MPAAMASGTVNVGLREEGDGDTRHPILTAARGSPSAPCRPRPSRAADGEDGGSYDGWLAPKFRRNRSAGHAECAPACASSPRKRRRATTGEGRGGGGRQSPSGEDCAIKQACLGFLMLWPTMAMAEVPALCAEAPNQTEGTLSAQRKRCRGRRAPEDGAGRLAGETRPARAAQPRSRTGRMAPLPRFRMPF